MRAIDIVDGTCTLVDLPDPTPGPDEILVGAKVEYSSTLSADQLVDAINSAEDAIRAAVPAATVIYLEPDLHRPDHPVLVTPPDGSCAH